MGGRTQQDPDKAKDTAFPDDKLAWKPHTDARSVLEELRHVTIGLEMTTAEAKGERFDFDGREKAAASKSKTRASVVADMEAAIAASYPLVKSKPSLEEQSLRPIVNPAEMGSTASRMVHTLTRISAHARYFQRAFGDRAITLPRVASALADYQRTRMSGNSAWDRWQRGDARALSPSARRGWELFTGDAQCSRCHFGPSFTDGAFHNLGVGWDVVSERYADEGRGAITGRPGDRGAFKTPTLRDAARHPPYMHDGSLPTLRDVILFYERGGVRNPHRDTQIRPLRLSRGDIEALVDFLEALNGEGFLDRAPAAFPQ